MISCNDFISCFCAFVGPSVDLRGPLEGHFAPPLPLLLANPSWYGTCLVVRHIPRGTAHPSWYGTSIAVRHIPRGTSLAVRHNPRGAPRARQDQPGAAQKLAKRWPSAARGPSTSPPDLLSFFHIVPIGSPTHSLSDGRRLLTSLLT